jgi:sulfate adenylyltransferase subunit 1 (EFTu-like GTPase family)
MSVSFTGLTPNNLPTNQRSIIDANYKITTSLPSSAGTVNSTSLDLGDAVSGIPYATTETVNFQIVAPALNATQLPNAATVTYTIQDSADNSSFAAISSLATLVQTGASSAGAAATTLTVKLPPNARRYFRVSAVTANSPGDCSAASYATQLAF